MKEKRPLLSPYLETTGSIRATGMILLSGRVLGRIATCALGGAAACVFCGKLAARESSKLPLSLGPWTLEPGFPVYLHPKAYLASRV
jgi:hypothetical protein